MAKRSGKHSPSRSRTWIALAILIGLLSLLVIVALNSDKQEQITGWQWMPSTITGTHDWDFDQVYELRVQASESVTVFRMQVVNMPEAGGLGILGQQCLLMPGDELRVEMLGDWYAVGEVVAFERGNFVTITAYPVPTKTTAPEC